MQPHNIMSVQNILYLRPSKVGKLESKEDTMII